MRVVSRPKTMPDEQHADRGEPAQRDLRLAAANCGLMKRL